MKGDILLHVKPRVFGFFTRQTSWRLNSFWIFSIELITCCGGIKSLPVLSMVGYKGQLKSPPIITLSSPSNSNCLHILGWTVDVYKTVTFVLDFSIVNICGWLWNSTSFFVSCFCSLFGLDRAQTQTKTHFFGQDNQSEVSTNLFTTNLRTKNKRLCTVTVDSTSIATTLFLLLKFPGFHNQSPD